MWCFQLSAFWFCPCLSPLSNVARSSALVFLCGRSVRVKGLAGLVVIGAPSACGLSPYRVEGLRVGLACIILGVHTGAVLAVFSKGKSTPQKLPKKKVHLKNVSEQFRLGS